MTITFNAIILFLINCKFTWHLTGVLLLLAYVCNIFSAFQMLLIVGKFESLLALHCNNGCMCDPSDDTLANRCNIVHISLLLPGILKHNVHNQVIAATSRVSQLVTTYQHHLPVSRLRTLYNRIYTK